MSASDDLNPRVKQILELANERFGEDGYNDAERRVWSDAVMGERTRFDANTEEAERTVRADRLAWLLTEPKPQAMLSHRGLRVFRAHIAGLLDLNGMDLQTEINLKSCNLPGGIQLYDATLRGLYLDGSTVGHIAADRAKVAGNIHFRNDFKSTGPVVLRGATIGGNLDCNDAELDPTTGNALNVGRLSVAGSVFLSGHSFKSTGTLLLRGATIGGNLELDHAKLEPSEGNALGADSVVIQGNAFLRGERFKSTGPVILRGATIGGNLELDDAKLEPSQGTALNADNLTVKGNVFIRGEGFKSTAPIVLRGATIGRNLEFDNAKLEPSQGNALDADSFNVKGNVFIRGEGFKSTGPVILRGATIGGNLELDDAKLEPSQGAALNANSLSVKGSVFLRGEGFRSTGPVVLRGAAIGGQLSCTDAKFEPSEGRALDADGLSVSGDVFLRGTGFKAAGLVSLPGAKIDGDLDCSGGTFKNASGSALSAPRVQIKGSVYLEDGFRSEGAVRLSGSSIGVDLKCSGGTFTNASGDALNVYGSQINGGIYLREGFTASAPVDMRAIVVRGDFFLDDSRLNSESEALNLRGASIAGLLKLRPGERPKGEIDLEHAKAGMLWDNPATWPEKIRLQGFEYARFHSKAEQDVAKRLGWLSRCVSDDDNGSNPGFDPEPYEQLAGVYRKTGRLDSARRVLIEKEKRLGQQFDSRWRRGLWAVWGFFAGYGYKTSKAVGWSVAVILAGALIFGSGHGTYWDQQVMLPPNRLAHVEDREVIGIDQNDAGRYPAFNPLVYSLDVFVPLVDLEQTKYWQPMWNTGLGGKLLTGWMWFSIIAGWALTTLIVTGLTRAVRE